MATCPKKWDHLTGTAACFMERGQSVCKATSHCCDGVHETLDPVPGKLSAVCRTGCHRECQPQTASSTGSAGGGLRCDGRGLWHWRPGRGRRSLGRRGDVSQGGGHRGVRPSAHPVSSIQCRRAKQTLHHQAGAGRRWTHREREVRIDACQAGRRTFGLAPDTVRGGASSIARSGPSFLTVSRSMGARDLNRAATSPTTSLTKP